MTTKEKIETAKFASKLDLQYAVVIINETLDGELFALISAVDLPPSTFFFEVRRDMGLSEQELGEKICTELVEPIELYIASVNEHRKKWEPNA